MSSPATRSWTKTVDGRPVGDVIRELGGSCTRLGFAVTTQVVLPSYLGLPFHISTAIPQADMKYQLSLQAWDAADCAAVVDGGAVTPATLADAGVNPGLGEPELASSHSSLDLLVITRPEALSADSISILTEACQQTRANSTLRVADGGLRKIRTPALQMPSVLFVGQPDQAGFEPGMPPLASVQWPDSLIAETDLLVIDGENIPATNTVLNSIVDRSPDADGVDGTVPFSSSEGRSPLDTIAGLSPVVDDSVGLMDYVIPPESVTPQHAVDTVDQQIGPDWPAGLATRGFYETAEYHTLVYLVAWVLQQLLPGPDHGVDLSEALYAQSLVHSLGSPAGGIEYDTETVAYEKNAGQYPGQ